MPTTHRRRTTARCTSCLLVPLVVTAPIGCGAGEREPRARSASGAPASSPGSGRAQARRSSPAPRSAGAVQHGEDRAARVTFALRDDGTLVVTLAPDSPARGLAGRSVRVECVPQLRAGDGVARTLRWPGRSPTLRVRLDAPRGRTPTFCSVDATTAHDRSAHSAAILLDPQQVGSTDDPAPRFR